MQLEAQELLDLRHAEAASLESDVEQESPDEPSPPDLSSSSDEEEEEKAPAPAWTEDSRDVRVPPFDAPSGKQHGARHAQSPLDFLQLFLPPGLVQQWADYTRTTTLSSAVQRGAGGRQLKSCMPSWVCISTWPSALCRSGTCTGVTSTSSPSSPLSSLDGASSNSFATSTLHHRHLPLLPLTRCPVCVFSFSRCSTLSHDITCLGGISLSMKPSLHSKVAHPSNNTSPRSHTSGGLQDVLPCK